MKWTSVLFSDGRGKLGNQVVFSAWKGRTYMRAYVTPTNPNTLKQQANRDFMDKSIKAYQANIKGDVDAEAAWNEAALSRLISGYNLFVKRCRSSSISVDSEETGSGHADVTVTYTVGIDLADTGMYQSVDGGAFTVAKEPGTLEAGIDKTVVFDVTVAGTYEYWLFSGGVNDALGETDDIESAHCHWSLDEAAGVAVPASHDVTLAP